LELSIDPETTISFACNICGAGNLQRAGEFHREFPNCRQCGSTPRFRGIVHALSLGLMRQSLPLKEFPTDRFVRGLGMSEWDGYASVLAQKFDFTNTFFHQEPRLDVLSDDWKNYQNLDFIICTEVFEHVLQPLDLGFRNLRRMLKKGGVLVFSVPFTSAPETTEHFPGMVNFALCQMDGQWVVVSRKADGSYEVYDQNIIFHGGPGTVLEMRMFGQDALLHQLGEAGFEPTVLSQAHMPIGYFWPTVTDRPELGYPGLHYIILCRAV
jgi:SAM-dependent methyltransferase